jgi:hypothetical protein
MKKDPPPFINPNDYPDFWEQMKGFAEFTGKQLKEVSKPNNEGSIFVDKETQDKRMSICEGCSFFDKSQTRCRQCGCFMTVKTKFRTVQCPLKFW